MYLHYCTGLLINVDNFANPFCSESLMEVYRKHATSFCMANVSHNSNQRVESEDDLQNCHHFHCVFISITLLPFIVKSCYFMCFGVLVLSCSILKSSAWRASSSCHPLAWESLPQACWVRLVHCMLYPLAGAHVGSLSRTLPISRWWSCRLKFTWDDTWQSNPVWFYLENACLFY